MSLTGIGPKVADCICLMSLNHLEAIPVDTHVYQIAGAFYLKKLPKNKSVTTKVYLEIGDEFRKIYGHLAGWAQTVLFCSDLRQFKPEKSLKRKAEGIYLPNFYELFKSRNSKNQTKRTIYSIQEVTMIEYSQCTFGWTSIWRNTMMNGANHMSTSDQQPVNSMEFASLTKIPLRISSHLSAAKITIYPASHRWWRNCVQSMERRYVIMKEHHGASLPAFQPQTGFLRDNFPPLTIVTSFDATKHSIWGKTAPILQVLVRVSLLAKNILDKIEENLIYGLLEMEKLFHYHHFESFDVTIKVNTRNINFDDGIASSEMPKKRLPVEFNPAKLYLRDLRSAFGTVALFFSNPLKENFIGVLWKPSIDVPSDFRISTLTGHTFRKDGKICLDKDKVVKDFEILGQGIGARNHEKYITSEIACTRLQLQLKATLTGGQSFRYRSPRWKIIEKDNSRDNDEYLGVMGNILWLLRQTETHLQYKIIGELPYENSQQSFCYAEIIT
uniref:N-glycosylase/DNA lyase n=1 Tax=Phlebotomus papatasi TaxID=29031 RepID=A0A1B0DRI6_PHLPP